MFQDVERYLDFIIKHKLTQSQFLMLYLLYRKKYDAISKYKEAFPSDDGSMIGEGLKQDLVERGFIQKVGEGTKADDYVITNKFTNLFFADRHEAAKDFWANYPGFVNIQGANVPLTNMDKFAFANIYAERIDYSIDEHREVIKDLQFANTNNLIRSSIENFVRSQAWEKIRPIRLQREQVKAPMEESY